MDLEHHLSVPTGLGVCQAPQAPDYPLPLAPRHEAPHMVVVGWLALAALAVDPVEPRGVGHPSLARLLQCGLWWAPLRAALWAALGALSGDRLLSALLPALCSPGGRLGHPV